MTLLQLTSLIVCVAASVVTDSTSTDARTALKWHRHYDSAKEVAQAKVRPLVVVLENPTANNQKIDETQLREQDRKTLRKEQFELVRVNVTTDYGKKVAAAFGATRFPYTAVTDDRSRHIVFRKAGQMSENDWTLALATSSKTKIVQDAVTARKVQAKPSARLGISKSTETLQGLSKVEWLTSYDQGRDQMIKTGRPMLLYLTAPGCTYCEILKKEALTQQYLIDKINTKFTPVNVNGRVRKDLSDRFQVKMFPTLVVMRPTGEVVEMWSGFSGTDDFANHLSSAQSKLTFAAPTKL